MADFPTVPPLTVTVFEVGRFHKLIPLPNTPPLLPTVLPVSETVDPTCTDHMLIPQV